METDRLSIPAQGVQTGKYREIKEIKRSAVIHASAADVWQIVGPGFADVSKWSTAVDHSEGSGEARFEGVSCNNRHCDVNAKGFNKLSEIITQYSDEGRILSYDVHEGMPGFVTYANNRWRIIEAAPGKSQLEMTITIRMKPLMGFLMGWFLKRNLHKTMNSVMEDLKIYAETGKVSAAKRKRMAKLKKAA